MVSFEDAELLKSSDSYPDKLGSLVNAVVAKESLKIVKTDDNYTRIFAWGYTDAQLVTIKNICEYVRNWVIKIYPDAQTIRIKVHLFNIDVDKTITPNIKQARGESVVTLTPTHINSGFCYYAADPSLIYIYRRDEIGFILTHELMHAYNIDRYIFPDVEFRKLNIHLKEKYKIKEPASFEAVTDTLAVYAWSQFIYPDAHEYTDCIRRQTEFAWKQAVIVLHLQLGLKTMRVDKTIIQDTHAFEYFVVRAVILKNILGKVSFPFKTEEPLTSTIIAKWLTIDYHQLATDVNALKLTPGKPLRLRRNTIL